MQKRRRTFEDDPLASLHPGLSYNLTPPRDHKTTVHDQLIDEISKLPGLKIVCMETTRLFLRYKMHNEKIIESNTGNMKSKLQNIWLMNLGLVIVGLFDEHSRVITFRGIETRKPSQNNYREEFGYMTPEIVKSYVLRDPIWLRYSNSDNRYRFAYHTFN